VFRRLRQHVHRFHGHLRDNPEGGSSVAAGARIVGRWPSGAPIQKAPTKDNASLVEDNDFDFVAGNVADCPGKAHIRKVNPRGDRTPEDRLGHRMLRRGITFGAESKSTPEAPVKDNVERGLLFLAYMTSIQRQFEFVMTDWANDKNFHIAGAGADALLSGNWIEPTGGGYYFAPPISALQNELSR
jgi:Dyp-type peroxidase family